MERPKSKCAGITRLGFGLNFANIPSTNMDFQAEFLQNIDEFSPSWRKEVEKMKSSNLKLFLLI